MKSGITLKALVRLRSDVHSSGMHTTITTVARSVRAPQSPVCLFYLCSKTQGMREVGGLRMFAQDTGLNTPTKQYVVQFWLGNPNDKSCVRNKCRYTAGDFERLRDSLRDEPFMQNLKEGADAALDATRFPDNGIAAYMPNAEGMRAIVAEKIALAVKYLRIGGTCDPRVPHGLAVEAPASTCSAFADLFMRTDAYSSNGARMLDDRGIKKLMAEVERVLAASPAVPGSAVVIDLTSEKHALKIDGDEHAMDRLECSMGNLKPLPLVPVPLPPAGATTDAMKLHRASELHQSMEQVMQCLGATVDTGKPPMITREHGSWIAAKVCVYVWFREWEDVVPDKAGASRTKYKHPHFYQFAFCKGRQVAVRIKGKRPTPKLAETIVADPSITQQAKQGLQQLCDKIRSREYLTALCQWDVLQPKLREYKLPQQEEEEEDEEEEEEAEGGGEEEEAEGGGDEEEDRHQQQQQQDRYVFVDMTTQIIDQSMGKVIHTHHAMCETCMIDTDHCV